jgi:hypothetical protein
MITSYVKDKILFYLCDKAPLEKYLQIKTKELSNETKSDNETLTAILTQFEKFGFLSDLGINNTVTFFTPHIELHDFTSKGGFAIQEEIFKANIEKLGFEIDNLKKQLGPDHLDSIAKLSNIFTALLGGLSVFPK